MKSVFKMLPAAFMVLALAGLPAAAQQQSPAQAPAAKPVSPGALAAAKELLALKNTSALYTNAVPNMVERTKETLLRANLNYQKDLDEVAVIVTQRLAGRQAEIGEGWAQIYASQFTEQELKDLVAFYKSPLGQKLLTAEPQAIQSSMAYMNRWAQQFAEIVNGEFRAEMRKRGKDI
jgi:hypothetical protein